MADYQNSYAQNQNNMINTNTNSNNFSIDGKEIVVRIIKYILEGLMVGIAVLLIPSKKGAVSIEEILIISLVASATFSLLDMFSPSIGAASRNGVGLSIGANIAGGIPMRAM